MPLLGLLSLTTPSIALREFSQARASIDVPIVVDINALFSDSILTATFPLVNISSSYHLLSFHRSSGNQTDYNTTTHFAPETQPFDVEPKYMNVSSKASNTARGLIIAAATCVGFIFGVLVTMFMRRRSARTVPDPSARWGSAARVRRMQADAEIRLANSKLMATGATIGSIGSRRSRVFGMGVPSFVESLGSTGSGKDGKGEWKRLQGVDEHR